MIGHHIPRTMAHSKAVLQGLSENLYGRFLDRFAGTDLPGFVMTPLLGAYCRVYDVDRGDLETPITGYHNLREFFVRPMKRGARHIDTDPARLTSPVDGAILATGLFLEQPLQTLRIKGKIYMIDDLLGTDVMPAGFRSGSYVLFYLAPGDYHRFHSPMGGVITGVDYLPGTCRPVNRIGRKLFPEVYVTNRRVVIWIRSTDDPPLDVALVLIGAMGVGRMLVRVGDRTIVGDGKKEIRYRMDEPVPLTKGQDLGQFEFGSSALLICSSDSYRTAILAEEGSVRLGMPVVTVARRGETDA